MKDYREWFYLNYSKALDAEVRNAKDPARSFRHHNKRWRAWLPLDRTARIFEAGCGSGEFLYMLKMVGFENLYGVDLDPIQVKNAIDAGLASVRCIRVQDALVGLEEEFDLIAAFNFFEHVTKTEVVEILSAMNAALRPGGRVIAITPNGISPFSGTTRYWDFSHEQSFTPASWRQLARLTGYQEPVFEEYGPMRGSVFGSARCLLWSCIKLVFDFVSIVEVGRRRDSSGV